LEGSIQRADNRVRVNARLTDTRNGTQLWAEHYDRDLSNVFVIESEVAQTIARQLQAKLSPREKAEIEERPTNDLIAYDLYLRGRSILESYLDLEDPGTSLLQAVSLLEEATRRDPNFALAHNQLGQAYLQKQMHGEAIAELQKAVQLSEGSPTCMANLARAYAASGKRSEAAKLLSDLKRRSNPGSSHASEIAVIYTALGDKNQAMTWLEKGYEERFNPGVLLRPGFDPLRSDPRFQNLVRRIGLNP